MNAPLIRLDGVSKDFERAGQVNRVLDNVDLTMDEGEFTALKGPSGSGKSTLLHILGLLDRPSAGSYMLAGKDTQAMDDDELSGLRNKTIGFVFQSFHLIPYVTALENVVLPGLYAGTPRRKLTQRARELFDQVGLAERADYKPSSLSGGQQQRVAIARALINDPSLILADEPTGQLDSATSKEIMELLASINGRGKTVIVVTHDQETASFARRTVLVNDGSVSEERA
jgi:putative ABC transport system ATP-binding protein